MKLKKHYYISPHGYWQWNCGWNLYRFDREVGKPRKVTERALGHTEFQNLRSQWPGVRKTKHILKHKPYGEWRRMHDDLKLYVHEMYGEVSLLETDGNHAIIYNRHLDKKWYVTYETLTESKSQIVSRPEPKKRGRKPKYTAWEEAAIASYKSQGIEPTKEEIQTLAREIELERTKEKYAHLGI